jgi:hypothetical protein
MPLVLDKEVSLLGITPKQHPVRNAGSRIRWPFKAMLYGDYFVIDRTLAEKAKNASKSFAKRVEARKFSIRPKDTEGQQYIVRRVA